MENHGKTMGFDQEMCGFPSFCLVSGVLFCNWWKTGISLPACCSVGSKTVFSAL